MSVCPECEADIEMDEYDVDKGEIISCPECGVKMEKKTDDRQTHIWYESCPQCEDMYFDAGEFTDLKYDTFMDRIRDALRGRRPSA